MFVNALCLEDTASLVSLILSGSYNLPASSSVELTGPQSEGFNEDITFRSECSKVSKVENFFISSSGVCLLEKKGNQMQSEFTLVFYSTLE